MIRPGTDPAFALGLAQVMIAEKLYNEKFVQSFTDLPSLVRMDTLERVKATDVIAGHRDSELKNWTRVVGEGQSAGPTTQQEGVQIPAAYRSEFADFVVWDEKASKPVAVGHDQLGSHFSSLGIQPALAGTFSVIANDGKPIEVRPGFDLIPE